LSNVKDTGERIIPDVVASRDTISTALLGHCRARYELAARRAAGKRVLDIACGAGYGSRTVRDAGARDVVGVDCHRAAVDFATARYGGDGISFQLANAEAYDGGAFDVIASFETIEHLRDPLTFVRRARSMLTPGGVLLLSATTIVTSDVYGFHLHDFTDDTLRQLATDAGCAITGELRQTEWFSLDAMRVGFRYHPRTLPMRRLVSHPWHYVSRAWRTVGAGGAHYSNLTLTCEAQRP
jgi:SAM-dependent methyltransferase